MLLFRVVHWLIFGLLFLLLLLPGASTISLLCLCGARVHREIKVLLSVEESDSIFINILRDLTCEQ